MDLDTKLIWQSNEDHGMVAVKVRHLHVDRTIDLDLRLVNFLARVIDALPIGDL